MLSKRKFDITKAANGHPIETVEGKWVEVWCWDFNAEHNPNMQLIGRVKKGRHDLLAFWDTNGKSLISERFDLRMQND